MKRRTAMPRKRHRPEEIVAKLRRVDVLVSQGQSVADAVRGIGVTEVTYYRWRQEFGGLKTDQVKRMKELEAENARLRRAVSDLTLGKMILAVEVDPSVGAFGSSVKLQFIFGRTHILRFEAGLARRPAAEN
jgi:putative transposase